MPKVAFASTLLALALLVAWFWWQAPGDVVPLVPPRSSGATDATAPAVVVPDAANATAEAAERRAVDAGPTDAPADPSATAVRVRVVDAATTMPVPGAEVLWHDSTFDWSKLSDADRALQQDDLEELLRRRAASGRADADGRAVVRPQQWAMLIGRSGDLYGSTTWHATQPPPADGPFPGEVVLRLSPDQTLLVRTVDEGRRPVAGVTVQLTRTHRRPDGTDQRSVQNLAPSGPDGVTRLRHVQESFRPEDVVNAATLSARLTGGDSEAVTIDPQALPATPVDVVLPAFGSVLVVLLGPDGAPWPPTSGRLVRLTLPSWTGGALERGVNHVECDANGEARFAHVRCGLRLSVSGPIGWDRDVVIDGPRSTGEQVRTELRLPADTSFIAGRVLTEDGTVFAGSAQVLFRGGRGSASHALVRDAEGRFLAPVPDWIGRTPTITIREQGRWGETALEGDANLRGPLAPGRNDLGDVVLRLPPLLVAGEVVVAGGDTAILDRVALEIERRPSGERESWSQAMDLRVKLDPHKRFEVRGHARDQRFRVVVQGDGAPQPPREFAPGTKDLRIEVTPGGMVGATFLVDPLWEHLSYRLLPPGSAAAKDWRQQHREEGHPYQDGDRVKVGWNGLAAGTHRLLVGCRGLEPMVDLAVAVPAGGAADDPRLLDIDLRGRLRAIVVRVTDGAGKPLAAKATVALRGPFDPDATWHGIPFDGTSGDGERFVLDRPTDLWVVAEGQRGVTVAGVFADTTVALQAAPSVTLRWVDAPALPEGVSAHLSWSAPGWPTPGPGLKVTRGGSSQSGGADDMLGVRRLPRRLTDGRATAVVDVPFPVAVRLLLGRRGKPSQPVPHPTTLLDPSQLTDGQTIDLRAEPAAVQAVLDKLAGK